MLTPYRVEGICFPWHCFSLFLAWEPALAGKPGTFNPNDYTLFTDKPDMHSILRETLDQD